MIRGYAFEKDIAAGSIDGYVQTFASKAIMQSAHQIFHQRLGNNASHKVKLKIDRIVKVGEGNNPQLNEQFRQLLIARELISSPEQKENFAKELAKFTTSHKEIQAEIRIFGTTSKLR